MKIKIVLSILATVAISLTVAAEDRPMTTLKAQYDYVIHSIQGKKDNKPPYITKFVLQIAPGYSYFYDPQTFYIDSMENDPQGRIILDQAKDAGKI